MPKPKKGSWNALDRLNSFDLNLPGRAEILPTECYDLWVDTPLYYSAMLSAFARETQYRMWLENPDVEPELPLVPFAFLQANYKVDSNDDEIFPLCPGNENQKKEIFGGLGPILAGALIGFAAGTLYGQIQQLQLLGTEAYGILDVLGKPFLLPQAVPTWVITPPLAEPVLPMLGRFYPPETGEWHGFSLRLFDAFEWRGNDDDQYNFFVYQQFSGTSPIAFNSQNFNYSAYDHTIAFNFNSPTFISLNEGTQGLKVSIVPDGLSPLDPNYAVAFRAAMTLDWF